VQVSILKEVRVLKGGPKAQYHNRAKSPLGEYKCAKPNYTLKDLTPTQFFNGIQELDAALAANTSQAERKKLRYLYFSLQMENPQHHMLDLIPDVSPVELLQVGPGRKSQNKYHHPFKRHLWIGSKGITTQLHYDVSHNAFVQLVGSKRFYIMPPSDIPAVYMFPMLHPRSRDSRVEWAPNVTHPTPVDGFPMFNLINEVLVADLSPGDVLLLPAMWLHQVVALDSPTISVNVWSESLELAALPQLEMSLYDSQADFKEWTGSGNYLAASEIFLRRLLERALVGSVFAQQRGSLLSPEETSFNFIMNMLEQRYSSEEVKAQIADPGVQVPCQPPVKGAQYRKVKQFANRFATKMLALRPTHGIPTLLAKMVEITIAIAGGPQMGPAFLVQCVCGDRCKAVLGSRPPPQ